MLVNKDPAVDLLVKGIGNEKAYGVAVYDEYVQPEAQGKKLSSRDRLLQNFRFVCVNHTSQ